MRQILFYAMTFIVLSFTSCSKGVEDDGEDCENDNTTVVKFTNTGSQAMKVEVAEQLTPQYQAINPVVSETIAAGQTITKTIQADRYFIVWWNNCATTCNKYTSYAVTYEACSTNEEKRGL